MHACNELSELPASILGGGTQAQANRWELDAALAVLARTREEWVALLRDEATAGEREAVQQRLRSAQHLVARISGKLAAADL